MIKQLFVTIGKQVKFTRAWETYVLQNPIEVSLVSILINQLIFLSKYKDDDGWSEVWS